MASKTILNSKYSSISMPDFFSAYEDLASGKTKNLEVGTTFSGTQGSFFKSGTEFATPLMANADNIGSILGKTAELEAFKTRRKQQTNLQNQGVGRSQSILGGSLV
jgi:hypothetical protein